MPQKPQRQSPFRRDPSRVPAGFTLQERDLNIIKQVAEGRFLALNQIQTLFFDSYSRAAARVRKLWDAGYLGRDHTPVSIGSSPAIYYLTKQGLDLLVSKGMVTPEQIRWHRDNYRRKIQFKQHESALNDVKIALTLASKAHPTLDLQTFGRGKPYRDSIETEDPDKENERVRIPIWPDAWIEISERETYHYFLLELDRGTEKLRRIRLKLKGYSAYYWEEGFLRKYGQEGARKEDYPFRMLMTCETEEQRNTRMEQACLIGAPKLCLFAVFAEVLKDPLGPVWIRGEDYKKALKRFGVPIEAEERWTWSGDKRERDAFVRDHVEKVSIFD